MIKKIILTIFLFFTANAQILESNLAFKNNAIIQDDKILLNFNLTKQVYLYKNKINFILNSQDITNFINFPQHKIYENNEILDGNLTFFIPLNLVLQQGNLDNFNLNIKFTGCTFDGFCYPPNLASYNFNKTEDSYKISQTLSIDSHNFSLKREENKNEFAKILEDKSIFLIIFSFFFAGFLLSLTPCVLPMIPILSSLIASKSGKSGFLISLIYVFGVSLSYTIFGILAGLFGNVLQNILQNEITILIFCGIFIILALSMFGVFDININLNQKINTKKLNGNFSIFLFGVGSALIISPCVSAPLFGALIFIAQSQNAILGGLALFFLSLGMGIPLLVLGIFSKFIRPGIWMEKVKNFFGFLLIFIAIWLGSRVFGDNISLLLYGICGIFMSIFLGIFDETKTNFDKIKKSILIIIFGYSFILILGFASGGEKITKPISFQKTEISHQNFEKISNLKDLKEIINDSQKPVIVDFWASWCENCKKFDEIFSQITDITKDYKLIKIDMSKNDENLQEITKEFSIFLPPMILIFKDGKLQNKISGLISKTELSNILTNSW